MVTNNLSFLIIRSRETLGDVMFEAHFRNDLPLQYYGVENTKRLTAVLNSLVFALQV